MPPLSSHGSIRIPPRIPPYSGRLIVRVSEPLLDHIRARVDSDQGDLEDLQETASEYGFTALADLLSAADDHSATGVRSPRLLSSVSNTEIDEEEKFIQGLRGAFGPSTSLLPWSLMGFFAVDVRGLFERDVLSLRESLEGVDGVAAAYREPAYGDPSWPGPCDPPEVDPDDKTPAGPNPGDGQGYVYGDHSFMAGTANLKSGVNARAVWQCFGGAGVGFADLEYSWGDHLQLPPIAANVKYPPAPDLSDSGSHGTGTLGIVLAKNDGPGIVGIAPKVKLKGLFSRLGGSEEWKVAEALFAATQALSLGDVLLLEVQTVRNAPRDDEQQGLPIEVVDHILFQIQLATAKGITLVEAAGNGYSVLGTLGKKSHDLDDDLWPPLGTTADRSLKPGQVGFIDSGAIMVSGCKSEPSAADQHEAFPGCTLGERVDCFAWAENVLTTQAFDLYQKFGGTSAASAIVAGAACLVQNMWREAHGGWATPGQVRAILREAATGTPVIRPDTGMVCGVMPDLGAIANKLGLLPDVYIRDSLSDIGLTPNNLVYQSPDIVIRRGSEVPMEFLEGPMTMPDHHEVIPGLVHNIWVRIFNRGGSEAADVDVTVYWSEPSALMEPKYWKRVGDATVASVPMDPAYGFAKISWIPEWDRDSNFSTACLIAVAGHPMDPAPPLHPDRVTWQEFLAYVGNHNNMAWRNFTYISPSILGFTAAVAGPPDSQWSAAERPFQEFVLRGLSDEGAIFEFEIVQSETALNGHAVWFGIPKRLEASLQGFSEGVYRGVDRSDPELTWLLLPPAKRIQLGRVIIPASQEFRCRLALAVDPEARTPGERETLEGRPPEGANVAIRQLYRGLEVGRFTVQTKFREEGKRP